MKIIPLYKYQRDDGGITISPIKPEGLDFEPMFRLVADEWKLLSKAGYTDTTCIDTDTTDGWYEVESHVERLEIENAALLYQLLTGEEYSDV